MKTRILLTLFSLMGIFAFGQSPMPAADYWFKGSMNIGKGGTSYQPTNTSAWLEIGGIGTTKALILPRVNDTSSIAAPVDGMMIHSIGQNKTYIRRLGVWVELAYSPSGGFLPISDTSAMLSAYTRLARFNDSLNAIRGRINGGGVLSTPGQPNITSVGSLVGLTMAGDIVMGGYNISGGGNFTANNFIGALVGNAATASALNNALTFNNGGAGVASGTTFNGSVARTISYNTIGAAAATGGTGYIQNQFGSAQVSASAWFDGSLRVGTNAIVDGTLLVSSTARINGQLGIGGASAVGLGLSMEPTALSGTTTRGFNMGGTISTGSTVGFQGFYFSSALSTAAVAYGNVTAFQINAVGLAPGSSSLTNFYGFQYTSSTVAANVANVYMFSSPLNAATGRWNLYLDGTARNYINGNLQLGTNTATAGAEKLQVTGTAYISNTLNMGGGSGYSITAGGIDMAQDMGFANGKGLLAGGTRVLTMNDTYTVKISGTMGVLSDFTVITTSGNATMFIDRFDTGGGALLGYKTAGTIDWYIGTGATGAVTTSDYSFYSAGLNTAVMNLSKTTGEATFNYAVTQRKDQSSGTIIKSYNASSNASAYAGFIIGNNTTGNLGGIVGFSPNSVSFPPDGIYIWNMTAGGIRIMEEAAGDVTIGTNNTVRTTWNSSGLLSHTGALSVTSSVTASGFTKTGSSDAYILLGGGGHTLLSGIGGTSGTYTPTYTPLGNVDAQTGSSAMYTRIGNIVHVSGTISIQATASGAPTYGTLSLPVASSLSNGAADLHGVATYIYGSTTGYSGVVYESGGSAVLMFYPPAANPFYMFIYYEFSYNVN